MLRNPKFTCEDATQNPFISVPCGKCEICRYNDAISWRVRLLEEFHHCFNCFFVTFTYSDDCLPFASRTDFHGNSYYYACVSKRDVQNFFKRFRVYFERKEKRPLENFKYFLVSEYTPLRRRPHYHALLFNIPGYSANDEISVKTLQKKISEIWNNGGIDLSVTTNGRIAYVTNYLFGLEDLPQGYIKPFRLMSKRPPIGYNFLERLEVIKWQKDNLYNFYPSNQYKLKLPRYYRDKIFSEEDKIKMTEEMNKKELEDIFNLPIEQIKEYAISNSDKLNHMLIDYINYRNRKFAENYSKKHKKSRKYE